MIERRKPIPPIFLLTLLLAALVSCTPPATQPTVLPTPTPPPGWTTYIHEGQCGYVIDHPSNMDGTSQDTYSWTLNPTAAEPSGPIPNFIYISTIPDHFESGGDEIIYNYDPTEARTLLNLQVGESVALRDDPTLAPWFRYERLPDATLGNLAAQAYENEQPWEFPPSTKEIRYYLQANGCTYLVGGYLATVGGGQLGAIDQELFDQVLASFRLAG